MVLLILLGSWLGARQNFRLMPSSCLVPWGMMLFWHRFWKVRLIGCRWFGVGRFLIALLKFWLKVKLGFAQKPKLKWHWFSVLDKCFRVQFLTSVFASCMLYLLYLFHRRWASRRDFFVFFLCWMGDAEVCSLGECLGVNWFAGNLGVGVDFAVEVGVALCVVEM